MTEAHRVEQIDPATLLVDLNGRAETVADKQFVVSIRALGVLQPILAVRTCDGGLRVEFGHRRTLPCRAAKAAQAAEPLPAARPCPCGRAPGRDHQRGAGNGFGQRPAFPRAVRSGPWSAVSDARTALGLLYSGGDVPCSSSLSTSTPNWTEYRPLRSSSLMPLPASTSQNVHPFVLLLRTARPAPEGLS